MNDLMLHVERIVRPIAATQARKLRMRDELLAHLQATVEEERALTPRDESAAVDRATRRLGEPAALRDALQATVPAIERVLLARLPLSPQFETIERRFARVPGNRRAMTLGHALVLAGLIAAVDAPFIVAMRAMATPGRPAVHLAFGLVAVPLVWLPLLLACYRFVFTSARPASRQSGTLFRGAIVLALQVTITAIAAYAMVDRAATGREIACVALWSMVTLAVAGVIARRVGVWRLPYDEWLSLDLAVA